MARSILCIIPARGGSKRLPRKNVLPLCGKPLIAYSIEHAVKSCLVTKTVVSTDDTEIAEVAKACGAEVVWRPQAISDDFSTSESALLHALEEVEKTGFKPELVVFLQCTSPIRDKNDIDRAIETLDREKADSLLSGVINTRYLWNQKGGAWTSINYDFKNRKRDQDLGVEMQENGSIYVFKPAVLRQHGNRLGGKIAMCEMDFWSSCQIDSAEDFSLCEWALSQKKRQEVLGYLPNQPKLIVSDFDGVMTDNKVFVAQDGTESVICTRSDSWGMTGLKKYPVKFVVLSTEANSVVKKRCDKLGIPCYQGSSDKLATLKQIAKDCDVPLAQMIYIGNDTNDLDCIQNVGCGVAVADSHPEILMAARVVLTSNGGQGAIRELCDLVMQKFDEGSDEPKN